MIKKMLLITTTGLLVTLMGTEVALAERYKGNCLHRLGGGEDFDRCYVNVDEEHLSLQFRDGSKASANQSIPLDAIEDMTVQRVKKTTADRVLFSPVWKWKARFSLFKIQYVDAQTPEADTQIIMFRLKEKQGIPLMAELERLTSKNVVIVEPELEKSEPDQAEPNSDKVTSPKSPS